MWHHIRLEPGGNFGVRIENGFTNVGVVRHHCAAVCELNGLVVQTAQNRTAALLVEKVASRAAKLLKQFLALLCQSALSTAAAGPVGIRTFVQHIDPADHLSVLIAAILRAEQMVVAWLSSRKPEAVVAARYHVVTDTKSWYRKAVNNVFRGHRQLDWLPHRNMERVDLPAAIRVLHFPHPLLTGNEYFHRISRRLLGGEVELRTPCKHDQHHE